METKKEEVTKEKEPVVEVKQPNSTAPKQDVPPTLDPKIVKELEELRKFKAKVEEDKKKDVVVSDSFFGKGNDVVKQHKKKYSKFWEEMMKIGYPYKEE